MPTTFDSSLAKFNVSTVSAADALAGTGFSITCLLNFGENMSANIAETPTLHCGVVKTVGTPSITISGTGAIAADLAGTEVSAQGLKIYQQNRTRLYFAVFNTVSGTVAANEGAYMTGEGYFGTISTNYSANEIAQFDFEFAADGVVDLVP